MTLEDKELLLKDLCARLPYGVKLGFYASAIKQTCMCTLLGLEPQEDEPVIAKTENGSFYMLADNVKPYLFPLSSMTEEQKKELRQMDAFVNTFGQICFAMYDEYGHNIIPTYEDAILITNWCNKNHFDYRGLIPKGIANDATGLNIY